MTGLRALSIEQAARPTPRWVERAACRYVEDPEIFFDKGQDLVTMTRGTLSQENRQRREEAKWICQQCPVIDLCREHYIDEVHGVYGGLDKDERHALRIARAAIARSDADPDAVGREAYALFIEGHSLIALAKHYRLKTSQLRAYLDAYLRTPDGLRIQLEREVRKAFDEGMNEQETAVRLRITVRKAAHIRRKLGLATPAERVSVPAQRLSEDRWDSSVTVGGAVLNANYMGESEDGWLFMQVKYPQASTRKWMRPEDVHLGKAVRRHIISKGVGSGQKRKRESGDPAEVA